MRRIRLCLAALVLAFAPTAGTAVAVATAPAVHADQYDCTDSYLPCDGTRLDYTDTLGDAPLPYDSNWSGWDGSTDTSYLGDSSDTALGNPWWDNHVDTTSGLGD